jgi:hypothetical protein
VVAWADVDARSVGKLGEGTGHRHLVGLVVHEGWVDGRHS